MPEYIIIIAHKTTGQGIFVIFVAVLLCWCAPVFLCATREQLVENASSKRVYCILESFRLPKMAEQLRRMAVQN